MPRLAAISALAAWTICRLTTEIAVTEKLPIANYRRRARFVGSESVASAADCPVASHRQVSRMVMVFVG